MNIHVLVLVLLPLRVCFLLGLTNRCAFEWLDDGNRPNFPIIPYTYQCKGFTSLQWTFMSQRRLSKRSYAIKNRRLLEEKLFARSLKSKKKAKNTVLLAASDALSESDGASAFGPTSNSSVGGSPISLEWDSSGQSPPLFENFLTFWQTSFYYR